MRLLLAFISIVFLNTVIIAQNEPIGRNQPVMVYMDHLGSAVLFGGYANQKRLNDSWLWNGTWTEMNGSVAPSPRSGHAMTYDKEKKVVYLFGGRGNQGLLNDIWAFDGKGWKELKTQNAPIARQSHRIIYDPIQKRVYLFGGSGSNRNSLSDTWAFDGQSWTEIQSDVTGRLQHTMTYDPVLEGIVVFGGFSRKDGEKQLPSETLLLKNNQWQILDIDGPPDRDHHGAVYDSRRKAVLIFGGYNGTYLNDTWQFKNNKWTQLDFEGPFRAGKPAIFKNKTGNIILFGGASPEQFGLTDFWTLTDRWRELKKQ